MKRFELCLLVLMLGAVLVVGGCARAESGTAGSTSKAASTGAALSKAQPAESSGLLGRWKDESGQNYDYRGDGTFEADFVGTYSVAQEDGVWVARLTITHMPTAAGGPLEEIKTPSELPPDYFVVSGDQMLWFGSAADAKANSNSTQTLVRVK